MKFSSLILLCALTACGGNHHTTSYGKTTEAQLVEEKGLPLREEKIPDKESKMLIYPENEKYQIKDGIVIHGLKDPKGDEKLLLYWKHKFRNCNFTERTIPAIGHSQKEKQMSCHSLGLTIIYNEGAPYVSRVVEYEKY